MTENHKLRSLKKFFILPSILVAVLLVSFFYGMLSGDDPTFSCQSFSPSRYVITSCWGLVFGLAFKISYDESTGNSDQSLFKKQLMGMLVAGLFGMGSLFLLV